MKKLTNKQIAAYCVLVELSDAGWRLTDNFTTLSYKRREEILLLVSKITEPMNERLNNLIKDKWDDLYELEIKEGN